MTAGQPFDTPPLDFDDTVSEFITRMMTSHNVTPVNPTPEHSKIIGNVWQLRNCQGLVDRVDAQGNVS